MRSILARVLACVGVSEFATPDFENAVPRSNRTRRRPALKTQRQDSSVSDVAFPAFPASTPPPLPRLSAPPYTLPFTLPLLGAPAHAALPGPLRGSPASEDPMIDTRWQFTHHRLDAYRVALDALVLGDALARALPRGYGTLADQLRRALQGAFLQTSEAAARRGADRLARFRSARGEACEAAAAIEATVRLGLVAEADADPVLELLWRLAAMLTRLSRVLE